MKILDYLTEGKLDNKAILEIQKQLDEYEKLKDSYGFSEHMFTHNYTKAYTFYSKEDFLKERDDIVEFTSKGWFEQVNRITDELFKTQSLIAEIESCFEKTFGVKKKIQKLIREYYEKNI